MTRKLDAATVLRPAHFAHVVLRVRDLDACAAWYEQVLGAKTVFQNPFVCFLTYDDEHHRVALIQTNVDAKAAENAAGLDHFAYSFDSLGDLLATYVRLKRANVLPVWSINHGPTTSLYYEDPEGNRVEFQTDNFADRRDLDAFFATDAFARNPIGVEFDPDALVARYEKGDPIEELLKQGAA